MPGLLIAAIVSAAGQDRYFWLPLPGHKSRILTSKGSPASSRLASVPIALKQSIARTVVYSDGVTSISEHSIFQSPFRYAGVYKKQPMGAPGYSDGWSFVELGPAILALQLSDSNSSFRE